MPPKPMPHLLGLISLAALSVGLIVGAALARWGGTAEPPVPVGEPSAMVVRGAWDQEGKAAPVTHLARDGKTIWKGEPTGDAGTLVRVTLPAEGHTWDVYVRLPGR